MLTPDHHFQVKTTAGGPLAEYFMHRCNILKCEYIMWGQRIWDRCRDRSHKPWTQWRWQSCLKSKPHCVHGDRRSVISNHL